MNTNVSARLLLLLSLLWAEGVSADVCSEQNYTLSTQAEVEALGAEGCTTVEGSLEIKDSTNITNLDALSNLASIGYLKILSNSSLTNLDGLANVTNASTLEITDNPALDDLLGLSGITSLGGDGFMEGGDLRIVGNAGLKTLAGLDKVTTEFGSLLISNNRSLTDISALSNIERLFSLDLQGNALLTNLSGLNNVKAVSSSLSITDTALVHLDELSNIRGNQFQIIIENNKALKNINGLSGITLMRDYLSITGNTDLTNLDGLANVTEIFGTQYPPTVQIYDNVALENCHGLARLLGWPDGPSGTELADGFIDIRDNSPRCNSVDKILDLYSQLPQNRFINLLDTLVGITVASGKADGGAKNSARASEVQRNDKVLTVEQIPTLPKLVLALLSGLVGLFGIRRLVRR